MASNLTYRYGATTMVNQPQQPQQQQQQDISPMIINHHQSPYNQQQQQQLNQHHQHHHHQNIMQTTTTTTPNPYELNNIQQRKRNLMMPPTPVYMQPKVCKSPVVIHSVKSKYVTKATPQAASVPMQPIQTNSIINNLQQPYQNQFNNNNSQKIYQQQQQQQQQQQYVDYYEDSSYSFRDMNQVLSKLPIIGNINTNEQSQLSPIGVSGGSGGDRLDYSTSFNNYSISQYSSNGIPLVQNNNTTRLSNHTFLSDVDASYHSHHHYQQQQQQQQHHSSFVNNNNNNKDNFNSESFLNHDTEMKEPVVNHEQQQQLSSVQYERRLPPPPYPGKLNDSKTAIQKPQQEASIQENHTSPDQNKTSKTQPLYVRTCSPQAFKFFMEQHIENVFKHRKARDYRRMQLENEMLKAALPDELQDQMRKLLCQKETNYIRLKRAKMNKIMFETIKLLGNGAFGEVNLVRKIDTGRLYAMKTLHKTDVFNRNQAAHVKAERDILAEADNEWVVKLYYSFQDDQNLYFVMDYIPGGDLMNLLIKLQIFEEPLAQFYIAELVCAIESVHNLGFIHRDIKPDNILIDKCGHIKLTDFGLCTGFHWTHSSKYYNIDDAYSYILERKMNDTRHKQISYDSSTMERRKQQKLLAHSLVGTPNYIAPEILSRKGYTKSCDWWSVGVILYEMLVGEPPFRDETSAGTQQKVINWKATLHIPQTAPQFSEMAKDLIFKLCTDEEKRLGNNGANEIKAHSFFQGIDFTGNLRKTKALYTPQIKYPTDTSNFEPIDTKSMETSKSPEKDKQQNKHHHDNNNKGGVGGDYYNNQQSNNGGGGGGNGIHSNDNNNSANNSKNHQILYEFTFRRFFDEAYSEHFNVQSDEDDQNLYLQRRQLSKNNVEKLGISKESDL